MSRLIPLAAVALTLCGAALLPSDADAAARDRHCAGTFGPRGEPGQGFWRDIRVKRTSCRRGKRVIRAYLRTGGGVRRVRGYRCRIRIVTGPGDPDGTGHLRCVSLRGGRALRATGHP
jgi:hypothetical protein